jgi:uncharacterized protein (DUF169 family)
MKYMTCETQQTIGLSKPPIAIGFLDAPPAGIGKWEGRAMPAGCSFWREAMNGKSFYTLPADHHNCAVGSYTHGISLPTLGDTVGFMVDSGYLQMAEVPGIPALAKAPACIAYAPVNDAAFAPDVVVIAARPASAMLIYEAAVRAGAGNALTNSLGRPACAVLPLALNSDTTAVSFGCKGNRTFTGLPDEELYIAVPGAKWNAFLDALESIVTANAAMAAHYQAHDSAFRAN